MAGLSAFSLREIGAQERLQDFATDELIQTASGINLHVMMVCDGAGGATAAEQAARLTSRTILDALEVSEGENIPAILVTAVEEANRVVYSELRGSGSTTVTVVAVNVDEGEYGRAYIASVGHSRAYLIRDRQMVRLNIDHTLANEYIYTEQMSANQAARLENANYPTRLIGINPEVVVDIGFYVERGNPFVNAQRAFNIGKRGMLLKEGDTLFVASRSIFEASKVGGGPVVPDQTFLDFRLDSDPEHAVRAIFAEAVRREPEDNITMSMMFVPSRFRRRVATSARLRPWQRALIALAIISVFSSAGLGAYVFITDQADEREQIAREATFIAVIAQASWTATFTPTTTSTPTPTATFTPTPRPTSVAENQVAVQYFRPGVADPLPVFLSRRAGASDINYHVVDGGNVEALAVDFRPASVFLQAESFVQYGLVNNVAPTESISMQLFPASDMYVNTGNFENGGVRVNMQLFPDTQLEARAACFSAKQIPPDPNDPNDTDKVAFTCYAGNANATCTYRLTNGTTEQIPFGTRVLLDLTRDEFIIAENIYPEEIKLYRDTAFALLGSEDAVNCLSTYLDFDGDGVIYPNDECENEAGRPETAGCPDDDLDGIRNSRDDCPAEPGPIENGGCPLPTPTPINLDPDGDGLIPPDDECPTEFGPIENNGCPIVEVDSY